jgi:hypothetical protein
MTTRHHPPIRPRGVQSTLDPGLSLDRYKVSQPTLNFTLLDNVTTPQAVASFSAPPGGDGVFTRLIHLAVQDFVTAGAGGNIIEVYFGDGGSPPANIEAAVTGNEIDVIRIANQGRGSTKTWGQGLGPRGLATYQLYVRFRTAPGLNSYYAICEFTVEY